MADLVTTVEDLPAVEQAICDFCGARGSFDMWEYPAVYRRAGRRDQGAMVGKWVAAEYSPTLDAVACPQCWKPRFFGASRREAA